jgi:hypothetical protein
VSELIDAGLFPRAYESRVALVVFSLALLFIATPRLIAHPPSSETPLRSVRSRSSSSNSWMAIYRPLPKTPSSLRSTTFYPKP